MKVPKSAALSKGGAFAISVWGAGLFFFFAVLGMLTYRGGNPTNLHAGYVLWNNFLSDLGTVEPYSNLPQALTNALWGTALGAAALSVYFFVQGLTKQVAPRAMAALSAIVIISLGFVPSDIYLWPHRLILLAFVLLLAITFYLLLPVKKLAISALFWTMFGYAVFLVVFPHPDASDTARLVHIIMQKLIVLFVFGSIWMESRRQLA